MVTAYCIYTFCLLFPANAVTNRGFTHPQTFEMHARGTYTFKYYMCIVRYTVYTCNTVYAHVYVLCFMHLIIGVHEMHGCWEALYMHAYCLCIDMMCVL